MNWSLVSGISYLLLLGLIPAVVLWLAWRNTPPRSPAFGCALLGLIVFPFIFGGTWFALPYWLSRGPGPPPYGAYPVWLVFVMCGTMSHMFFTTMFFGGCLVLVIWRRVHPASFTRFTARPADAGVQLENQGTSDGL